MKCPLFQEYWVESKDRHTEDCEVTRECFREECAWWVGYDNSCVLVSLNNEARVIRVALKNMEYKMPHEAQFRK